MRTNTFWDKRAVSGSTYKGEKFYTITPLPFYVKRRKLLLKEVERYILPTQNVLDFGCGDGWYINYFNKKRQNNKSVSGIDISEEMVKNARKTNPTSHIYQSNGAIKSGIFDIVYTFAVLAHIKNNTILESVFSNCNEHLNPNGYFILFEQVAPQSYEGENFIRRTILEYENIAHKHGFITHSKVLLSFNSHRFFERHIAKLYCKLFCGGNTVNGKIRANSHWIFRKLSALFLLFDTQPLIQNPSSGWGNVLLILKKTNQK